MINKTMVTSPKNDTKVTSPKDGTSGTSKNIILGLLGIILLVGMVSAFGVVSYGEPVKVKPGESINLSFSLQNMVGEQSYTVDSQIGAEPGIELTLLDNKSEYLVPVGSEIPVKFIVRAPKEAEIGKNYTVSATFTARATEGSQSLGLKTAIGTKVIITIAPESDDSNKITPVIPKNEKKANNPIILYLIILILIILILIIYLYMKNKKN